MSHPNAILATAFLGVLAVSAAGMEPNAIFGDRMVLQRGMAVPVWGTAAAGEKVTVRFAGQEKAALADANGTWQVRLDPLAVGDAGRMTVAGEAKTVTFSDVLVGEVWLCAGQSNMAMTVGRAAEAKAEVAAAKLPRIRQSGRKGWVVCSPETAGGFSATAFYFARDLHASLDVPVGLIVRAVGGTRIEQWTARPWLTKLAYGRTLLAKLSDPNVQAWLPRPRGGRGQAPRPPRPKGPMPPEVAALDPGHVPSSMYDRFLAGLAPFAIRGVIWYQGERNAKAGDPRAYAELLPNLIANWRSDWRRADLPFGYVQLPNLGPDAGRVAHAPQDAWPVVREAALRALRVPGTGMAVTIDVGGDLHPKNKQAVGRRLALWARQAVYGEKIVHSGPIFQSMQVDGGKAVLRFAHVGGGLVAKGGTLGGFVLAGADRKFVPARAVLGPAAGPGQAGKTVIVSSERVPEPVAVRYAWADNPVYSLLNDAGLPASPFRTDDWPLATVRQSQRPGAGPARNRKRSP